MKDQDPCFQELVCPKVLIYAAHFLELFNIYIINTVLPGSKRCSCHSMKKIPIFLLSLKIKSYGDFALH